MTWGKLCGDLMHSSVERVDEELVIPSGLDQKYQATRLCSTGSLVILSPVQNISKALQRLNFLKSFHKIIGTRDRQRSRSIFILKSNHL